VALWPAPFPTPYEWVPLPVGTGPLFRTNGFTPLYERVAPSVGAGPLTRTKGSPLPYERVYHPVRTGPLPIRKGSSTRRNGSPLRTNGVPLPCERFRAPIGPVFPHPRMEKRLKRRKKGGSRTGKLAPHLFSY
jgi:hypothetical protein